MFRIKIFLFIIIFLVSLMLVVVFLFGISPKDYLSYHKLMESSQPQRYLNTSPKNESLQKRQNVTKNIWFTDNNKRMRFWLKSETSELSLFQENNSICVIENMYNVTGFMQQKLYYTLLDGREVIENSSGSYFVRGLENTNELIPLNEISELIPMQQVRYFTANQASYHFKNRTFLANDVTIYVYKTPGHQLTLTYNPENTIMEGTAESAEFTFFHETPSVKMYNLDASFYSKKGLL